MDHIRNNFSAFILGVIAVLLFVVAFFVALMSVLVLRTKKKRDRDAVRERKCQHMLPITNDSHPNVFNQS